MVTLAWGNPGVARYRDMATLPAGYVPQRKVPWASSSGSLGFIRMVDRYQLQLVVAYYLYPVANTVRPSVDMVEIITPA